MWGAGPTNPFPTPSVGPFSDVLLVSTPRPQKLNKLLHRPYFKGGTHTQTYRFRGTPKRPFPPPFHHLCPVQGPILGCPHPRDNRKASPRAFCPLTIGRSIWTVYPQRWSSKLLALELDSVVVEFPDSPLRWLPMVWLLLRVRYPACYSSGRVLGPSECILYRRRIL